jgi:hypothetical protein
MSRLPITRPLDVARDLNATSFEDVDISLHDLFMAAVGQGQGLIHGRTFTGCRIQGPGVMLVSTGTTFDETNFGDSRGGIANLVLRPAGDKAIGAVPVRDCAFLGCEFYGVGFTGTPEFIEQLLGLSTPAGAK